MQAGAALALLEAGLEPDLLVGSSVGALNAAFLAAKPGVAGGRALMATWSALRRRETVQLNPALALADFLGLTDQGRARRGGLPPGRRMACRRGAGARRRSPLSAPCRPVPRGREAEGLRRHGGEGGSGGGHALRLPTAPGRAHASSTTTTREVAVIPHGPALRRYGDAGRRPRKSWQQMVVGILLPEWLL